VFFRGRRRDPEGEADVAVAVAAQDEVDDLGLAVGQPVSAFDRLPLRSELANARDQRPANAVDNHFAQVNVERLAVARGDQADGSARRAQIRGRRLGLIAVHNQQIGSVFPPLRLGERPR
jgi:hypothetical protein